MRHPSRTARRIATGSALLLASSLLAACGDGGGGGRAQLNWYINPDGQETLTKIAEKCSTDDYDINIQLLPASATDQRTQLARRLAAEDDSTDLMSLDPVFVPEMANAGWLAELDSSIVDDDVLEGAAETVRWEDKIYAAPQWANTQVLWHRKSLAKAAGLDMTKPVTWDQVIEAARSQPGATVGVQANKYEAYVVWINAMILGAGGNIVTDNEAGREAKVTIDSEAGKKAAAIIEKLSDAKRKDGSTVKQADFTVSNEGTSLGQMFPAEGPGEFMVNWTFVYKNYEGTIGQDGGPKDKEAFADLGWARYPATVEGEQSKPPIGGIDIGVGAFSQNLEAAKAAAKCVTSPEAQEQLAVNDGLMPSRQSVYESDKLKDAYPADLLALYRESIDTGGPRPKSAFYNMISSAVQSSWHSPTSVDPETTPKKSAEFLSAVLEGRSLL